MDYRFEPYGKSYGVSAHVDTVEEARALTLELTLELGSGVTYLNSEAVDF